MVPRTATGRRGAGFRFSAHGARGLLSARRLIPVILAVSVVLRAGSALYQGNEVIALPGVYDQLSYHALAERVANGYGFSFERAHWPATRAGEPTAHWSYLYTLYLTAIYAAFGSQPLWARLLQAVVVGILHVWLIWRIGNQVFGAKVGMLAAAFSAVYVYFVYYAGSLLTEPFYIVGVLWTLDCTLRLGERYRVHSQEPPSPRSNWGLWLELGLAVGVTVLLRQLYLLIVPFLLLWLWWSCLPSRRWSVRTQWRVRYMPLAAGSTLALAIVAALILPWTVRNYRAFDTFVPLNTNSGYAFFWGNHPIYGTHFVGILPADGPSYYNLIPPELLHLNEAELDKALLQRGLAFVRDDPGRYLLLSLSRTREYFKFWPSSESSTISNISRLGSFGLLLPFMLYGLRVSVTLVKNNRGAYQQSAIVLLWLFMAVYTGIHLMTWALIRYRLPVDAVLLLFAALGIVDLAQRLLVREEHAVPA